MICKPAGPLQRSLGPFGPEMPKKSRKCLPSASSKPTTEFAQPRLSRVKRGAVQIRSWVWSSLIPGQPRKVSKKSREQSDTECTAVAAIRLRMGMRILTRPENSLANFSHQISEKKLRIRRCEGIRNANANGFANEIAKISFSHCANSLRMDDCDKIC